MLERDSSDAGFLFRANCTHQGGLGFTTEWLTDCGDVVHAFLARIDGLEDQGRPASPDHG